MFSFVVLSCSHQFYCIFSNNPLATQVVLLSANGNLTAALVLSNLRESFLLLSTSSSDLVTDTVVTARWSSTRTKGLDFRLFIGLLLIRFRVHRRCCVNGMVSESHLLWKGEKLTLAQISCFHRGKDPEKPDRPIFTIPGGRGTERQSDRVTLLELHEEVMSFII